MIVIKFKINLFENLTFIKLKYYKSLFFLLQNPTFGRPLFRNLSIIEESIKKYYIIKEIKTSDNIPKRTKV